MTGSYVVKGLIEKGHTVVGLTVEKYDKDLLTAQVADVLERV